MRIDAGFALRHNNDGFVFSQRVNQLDRTFPAHGQGQHRMGEQNRIAHRQDRKRLLFLRFVELRGTLWYGVLAHDAP
jgi:hypothetical protein